MTKAKSLLLGSAAALVAVSGAHAADLGLPVAPSVDYVQICTVGGFTGFLLPGSDVCFDISGFARFQAEFDADINSGDDFNFEGVGELNFDARSMTEYGMLRGFIRIDATGGNAGDTAVQLQKAFIQIGGLTAGYTDSFFDMVYTDYALGQVGAPDGGSNDMGMIGYAYSVGNGVTLMASLEEGESRIRNGAVTVPAPGTVFATDVDYGMPDFVAAIRVDQAWGSAKLSAALTDVDPNRTTNTNIGSEMGYAIGVSAEFNLPVGVNSNFGIFGIYTDGALGYAGVSAAYGAARFSDFVYTNAAGTTGDTTTAYALGAGFEFGLSSMLDLEIDAYYASIDSPVVAATVTTAGVIQASTPAQAGVADGSLWAVRGSLAYRPVSGLELRGGVGYTSYDLDGDTTLDDAFGATFRITRSF